MDFETFKIIFAVCLFLFYACFAYKELASDVWGGLDNDLLFGIVLLISTTYCVGFICYLFIRYLP